MELSPIPAVLCPSADGSSKSRQQTSPLCPFRNINREGRSKTIAQESVMVGAQPPPNYDPNWLTWATHASKKLTTKEVTEDRTPKRILSRLQQRREGPRHEILRSTTSRASHALLTRSDGQRKPAPVNHRRQQRTEPRPHPLKPGSLLSTCFLRHIPPRGRREAAKRRASPDHADPEPTRITIDGKRHRRAASRHHPSAAPQHVQRQSTSSPLASSVRLPYSIRSNGPYNSQIRCLITDLKTDIVQERRMPPSARCRFHAICRHGQPTFFVFLHRVSPRNPRYTGKENKQTIGGDARPSVTCRSTVNAWRCQKWGQQPRHPPTSKRSIGFPARRGSPRHHLPRSHRDNRSAECTPAGRRDAPDPCGRAIDSSQLPAFSYFVCKGGPLAEEDITRSVSAAADLRGTGSGVTTALRNSSTLMTPSLLESIASS